RLSARTPAWVAMTAATIDHLSGGRLLLGVGVSGPQVVEGWYGQAFPRPMGRTREFVRLLRTMLRREGPVTFDGEHYTLPFRGGAQLGKPLKLIIRPLRAEIPIYLGAEGPKNVAMATEIADGWLPLFYSPFRTDVYRESLRNLRPGSAGGRDLARREPGADPGPARGVEGEPRDDPDRRDARRGGAQAPRRGRAVAGTNVAAKLRARAAASPRRSISAAAQGWESF